MGTRDEAPSLATQTREAAEYHDRVLLRAWHTAHPVLYQDKKRFIHSLYFGPSSTSQSTIVYLTGDPTPLRPDQVQLAPKID